MRIQDKQNLTYHRPRNMSSNWNSIKGGVARGSCAHSFGVCCVFTSKCGEKSYQNGSYLTLDQNSFEKGSCSYQVCSTDPNVCKLRLDFESLVLTGKNQVEVLI